MTDGSVWGTGKATASEAYNMTMNDTIVSQTQTQFNQTKALINSLLLSKVQATRSMHVALAAFSLGISVLTILRIFSDAMKATALRVPLRER
jgi:hypothetical protein